MLNDIRKVFMNHGVVGTNYYAAYNELNMYVLLLLLRTFRLRAGTIHLPVFTYQTGQAFHILQQHTAMYT
jgi:hypothetical protein